MSTFTLSFMEEKTSHIILSVIVPVYNVERFLPRCLDSLLRQGMQSGEWEIICVDDGSTDGSPAILADYARRNPELIRVIRQENQGLGGARNTGTAAARGEWVAYLDSDDYLIDGAYAYLCQHFLGSKPDVLTFDFRYVYTDGQTLVDPEARPDGKVTFDGDGVDAYNQYALPFVWPKFYKRAFLETHNIQSEIVISQDELFNFEVFRRHPHTVMVDCNVCRYEQKNEHSMQKIKNPKKVREQLDQLLFHNVTLMEDYLREGNSEMAPAATRNINNFLNVYHRKILLICLGWKEWSRYTKREKELPVFTDPDFLESWVARLVIALKRLSGKSYVAYLALYLFNRYIFKKYIAAKVGG